MSLIPPTFVAPSGTSRHRSFHGGMAGMAAWLDRRRHKFDSSTAAGTSKSARESSTTTGTSKSAKESSSSKTAAFTRETCTQSSRATIAKTAAYTRETYTQSSKAAIAKTAAYTTGAEANPLT
ncbi:hypothetical protein NEUTE1DRAFT_139766 [Neurospora tetrasperma FGSC 2508]|uniref:Uncharacterized protein n=1 Tax=Neurospora tetrasperma (strain FGSC 2508 / ATCC MYA-4615 / P0657) TaxID=510951 RepID=F8MU21_NEUT8|nr:uncharacterized protein NEUTE1DRAFT_139766 [Neurospora tetrasperma FGSC 2508]EGO55503.1 hypothetical protein NEUTE1DRAFT_139766 [Neurospora tetrasperma FGSC 2508]